MTIKKSKSKFNKIIVTSVLAFSMFTASFAGYKYKPLTHVSADYHEEVSLIANNTFANHTSADNPSTPTSWEYLNPTGSENIKAGVISVYDSTFNENRENYNLNTNPGKINNENPESSNAYYKNLMINAGTTASRAGYKSGEFNLSADSYYVISVIAKTQIDETNNTSARGSIYLEGLSDSEQTASFENFNTNNNWYTYKLYVKTHQFNTETVSLQLYLGTKLETSLGAVFFNNVEIRRYSKSLYESRLSSELSNPQNAQFVKNVNLSEHASVPVNQITNNNFQSFNIADDNNIIPGFTTLHHTSGEDNEQELRIVSTLNNDTGLQNPRTNFRTNDYNVLFMQNNTLSYQAIESSVITLAKQQYYKISVWAKTNSNDTANPTVKLVQNNYHDEEDFTAKSVSVTVATSETTNKFTNNWTEYSIYVEGHPLKTTYANLQLWLGSAENLSTGYVFYDDIQVQTISYADYSAGTDSSNNTIYSFNDANNQFIVLNGNFNLVNSTETEITYPATPRNWALSNSDANYNPDHSVSGIVSTDPTDFSHLTTNHSVNNPGLTPLLTIGQNTVANTANNVLMIGQLSPTNQIYTSDSFNLSAGTIYRIRLSINTQFAALTENTGASIELKTTDSHVFALNGINTGSTWQEHNIYIKTNSDISVSALLGLKQVSGFVFFDDVMVTTISETAFEALNQNITNRIYKINLTTETFNQYETNSPKALNTPFNWSVTQGASTEGLEFGILNTSHEQSLGINPNPVNGQNVLMIHSTVDAHITAKSANAFTIDSDKYYKLSVKVKTNAIGQDAENVQTDDNDHAILPGASIKLDNFDKSFNSINTATSTNNEWTDYVFYIKSNTSTTASVEISLGNSNALTSGYVFVDSIVLEELDKDVYTTQLNENSNLNTTISLTEAAVETEEPDTEGDGGFKGINFDFMLVSSILLVLAIAIALIGSLLRRLDLVGRIRPKVKTKYDRRKTIELEMDKRERIKFRKEIIVDLQSEFDLIDQEIEEFIRNQEVRIAQLKQKEEERKQHHTQIKSAILLEIEEITKAFNTKKQELTDNKQLAKEQAKYEKEIKQLNAKKEKSEKESAKNKLNVKSLQTIRERYLEKQQYRKTQIKLEIERIEREIEEIAREEEIMWSEYRKAKEEAKRAKHEYNAAKRAEKQKKSGNDLNEVNDLDEVSEIEIIEDVSVDTESDNTDSE